MSEILSQKPTLEVLGVVYTFRRLGILDVRKVAGILAKRLGQLASLERDAENAGIAVAQMMLEELETLTPIIADVMGVTREQFEDPEVLPLPDVVRVIEALATHPDIAAFVKNVQNLAVSPAFQTRRAETPLANN